MMQWVRSSLLGLLLAAGLSACAQGPVAAGPEVAATTVEREMPAYKLGVADKLRVNVFGEDSITGEYLVGSSGNISLPLIGEVKASGLTIPEFQTEVANTLKKGYITAPRVSAEVLNYRPFYILGEVNKPGEYPFTNSLTVLNAVATANGFTYRADQRRVYIKRVDGDQEREYPLTTGTKVAPGDTIRIGERFF